MHKKQQRSFWIVFKLIDGRPIFFGLFKTHNQATEYAAKIEGARVERVPLREGRSAVIPDIKALIG